MKSLQCPLLTQSGRRRSPIVAHLLEPAGRERGAGGAELMASEDPGEHHAGTFPAEAVSGQFHSWRHGRDPIKTIEHREQRQAIESEISERQIEQRQSTLQD